MASTYKEPVKITVEMAPSFTVAALNKCLIITKEHKSEAEDTKKNEVKTFSSSAEVGEYFGNNSETFKAVEFFLGQKRYPAKQPLIPDFFTVLSVDTTTVNKEAVLKALNGVLGNEFYAVCLSLIHI